MCEEGSGGLPSRFCYSNGLFGFFYVESKSYELRSRVGNEGFRLAEWSKGLFRSVEMGFPSMVA